MAEMAAVSVLSMLLLNLTPLALSVSNDFISSFEKPLSGPIKNNRESFFCGKAMLKGSTSLLRSPKNRRASLRDSHFFKGFFIKKLF